MCHGEVLRHPGLCGKWATDIIILHCSLNESAIAFRNEIYSTFSSFEKPQKHCTFPSIKKKLFSLEVNMNLLFLIIVKLLVSYLQVLKSTVFK